MLQFYYARETVALATHITLLDAGVEFESIRLSFLTADHQKGDYAKLNPKLRVPTLVTSKGPLTETPAILAYLAQTNPNAGLAPLNDPFTFAKVQEFNLYIASTLHVAHAHRMRGHRWVDPQNELAIKAMQEKVPESVAAAFTYIEQTYLEDGFVLGGRYSIADPYLFTVARWIESDGVDAKEFPKIYAHREMMMKRPSVKRALAEQSAQN